MRKPSSLEVVKGDLIKTLQRPEFYNSHPANLGIAAETPVRAVSVLDSENPLINSGAKFFPIVLYADSNTTSPIKKLLAKVFDFNELTDRKRALRNVLGVRGAIAYEWEHGRFWNQAHLPTARFVQGIINNNAAAIVMEDLKAPPLYLDLLALKQTLDKETDLRAQQKLTACRRELILKAAYTINDFAVTGSRVYHALPKAQRPANCAIHAKYIIDKGIGYLTDLFEHTKEPRLKTIDRESAFSAFFGLQHFIATSLVGEPSQAVYLQRDEGSSNLIVTVNHGAWEVKFVDSEKAGFGAWSYAMAKLFVSLPGITNSEAVELFLLAYQNLIMKLANEGSFSMTGKPLTGNDFPLEKQLIGFHMGRIYEGYTTLAKRQKDVACHKHGFNGCWFDYDPSRLAILKNGKGPRQVDLTPHSHKALLESYRQIFSQLFDEMSKEKDEKIRKMRSYAQKLYQALRII